MKTKSYGRRLAAVGAAIVLVMTTQATSASAAVNNVSVQLSNPTPSATAVNYTWTWNGYQTAAAVFCVLVKFSVNADGTGGIPTGMSVGASTLTGTFGGTWTPDYTSAATGIVAYNWATGVTPAAGPTTLVVGNVTNSSTAAGATYYETLTTYAAVGTGASGACAGAVRDPLTVVAFATSPGQVAQVIVEPSLAFTISPVAAAAACGNATTTIASTSNSINFGRMSAITQHPIVGQSLNVTTNAANGYTVYVSYSGAMTGVGTARPFVNSTGTNATPVVWAANGTESFGYHTESSTLSGTAGRFQVNKWAALTTSNVEVMRNTTTPGAVGDTNCVAYQMSIAGNTPADTYITTVRYDAAPVF